MISTEQNHQINELLEMVIEEIDIPEAKYKEAEERYKSVGAWLERPDSILKTVTPEVYIQGSFRLGTVIKPISKDGEYDIDSVCKLQIGHDQLSQKDLKHMVGIEIKSYSKKMNKEPEEGKRCWTLSYADESKFHMDILPAIPAIGSDQYTNLQSVSCYTEHAISITDNTLKVYPEITNDWLISNPKGYGNWFREQMKESVNKTYFTQNMSTAYSSVEDVPLYAFKTTLQRIVQLLKRHRDCKFGDSDDKPISIIITTLAAHAYNNEDNIIEAMTNIVDTMTSYIETRNGETWIPNPVNSNENFADKWEKHPERKAAFEKWHDSLKQIVSDLNRPSPGLQAIGNSIKELVGEDVGNKIINKFGENLKKARETGSLKYSSGIAMLGKSEVNTVKNHTFYGK